jgi:amidase
VVEDRPAVDGDAMAHAFLEVWAGLAGGIYKLILDAASERPQVGRLRAVVGDRRTMRLIARLDRRTSGLPAFEPFTRALAERSLRHTPADLIAAQTVLQGISHTTGEFMQRCDAFLSPVLGSPPIPLGSIDQSAPWDELIERLFRYVAFTPLANFTGLPAMSVPTHWTPGRLPVGAHFLGRYGDETTLFRLAGQLERAALWRDRPPPTLLANI